MRMLALITIFVIVGTLSGCGRYGKPVRPAPNAELFSGGQPLFSFSDHSVGVTSLE